MQANSSFISSILGLLLIFQASLLFASEPIVVRFATSNVKPWGFIDQAGAPTGLLIELAQALEGELASTDDKHIKINNHIRPYSRVIQEIRAGSVDFAVLFKSPDADKFGISIGKVADHKVLLIGAAGTPPIDEFSQLERKPIGHILGSKWGEHFDSYQALNIMPVSSMEQGINMLLNGRIYAFASTDQALYYALEKLQIPRKKITPLMTIGQVSTHLYFSKASARVELIVPFTEALSTLKEKAVVNTIFYQQGYVTGVQIKPD